MLKDDDQQTSSPAIYRIECWIGFFVGILILLLTIIIDPPTGMSLKAWHCMGMGLLMAIWWATEAVPIPVTALLPIVLIPALELGTIRSATAPYSNPTIYLFFGGFLLGLAMEKCNLHKRIALNILNKIGASPNKQVAGFMIATAFISMWVSNTATTIMMAPIGISVAAVVSYNRSEKNKKRFESTLLLGIAYAASIGGIATLIGTPPNALLRAFLDEQYNIQIGFAQWMLLGVPLAIILLTFTYWWMVRVPFTESSDDTEKAETFINKEIQNLGAISYSEKMVALIFSSAAFFWIFRPTLKPLIPFLSDTMIAVTASLLLFIIPVNAAKREFLMDWKYAAKMPWGILILFGGGLSLAGVINSSTLAHWIAAQLDIFGSLNILVMIAIITTSIIVLTEVSSNTATAAAFLPLVGAMAMAHGINPIMYAIPAAIAASCAFMLPVATPPNAIVFGSGAVQISDMIKAGFAVTTFCVIVIPLLSFLLISYIF